MDFWHTIKSIFRQLIFAVAVCLPLLSSASTIASKLDIQGHRGARAVLPENTLAALGHALELGVTTLEFDLGVSKDGVVVVSHNQEINPIICQHQNGDQISDYLPIHSLTLEQIKSFDCGTKQNPRFPKQVPQPGAQIPTLAEVFELTSQSDLPHAKSVLFNIETKSDPLKPELQPTPPEFVTAVLEVVNRFDMVSRVTIQSFDHRTLVETKRVAPEIQLAALFKDKPANWIKATKAAKADIVSPYFELIDSSDVKAIQAAGLQVIPWTPNTKQEWLKLMEMGVDGIITDDPEPLLDLVKTDLAKD